MVRRSILKTYLANGLQGESKVKPIADLYDASRRDDVVDALISLKGEVEQGQHRLIVGYIGGLENSPRGLTGLRGVKVFLALAQQTLAGDVVQVTEANTGAALETLLHETCTDSVGAS